MKAKYVVILVLGTALLTAGVMYLLLSELKGTAGQEDSFWEYGGQQGQHHRRAPKQTVEEMMQTVEGMIKYIEQTDPQRAEALKEMREKSPEKFKAYKQAYMQEQIRDREREHQGRRGRGSGGDFRRREMERMGRMRQKQADFLEWLSDNYPEEAKELEEQKTKNPKLYPRRLSILLKKYGRIAEASKDNHELAVILKKKLELNARRDELLKMIKKADEKRKEQFVADLRAVLSNKFDLIVKQKQMAYERLSEKLERLKEKVKASEAELAEREDVKFKNENVETRLQELLAGVEKFKWD